MNAHYAASFLAFAAVIALQSGPSTASAAEDKLKTQCLGNCALQITVPSGWDFEKHVAFESESYVFKDEHGVRRFNLYLGNNPNLASLRGAQHTANLSGNPATEYSSHGRTTDIVVRPRCGHDKYAWMTVEAYGSGGTASAMHSLRCTHG